MKKFERGSALIAVLFLIFTGGIITMAVLSLSKIGTFTVAAHVERQRSMLVVEGLATRVQWLLAADCARFPQEIMGDTDYSSFEHDRYIGDGVIHEIEYYGEMFKFSITDTLSGEDAALAAENVLRKMIDDDNDQDYNEMIERVLRRINDYADSDDTAQDDSYESAEYEEIGMKPLPRNGAMTFREELTFIPEFMELFKMDRYGRLSAVRLIEPPGSPSTGGTPSLFTATADMIERYCGVDEEKLDSVMEALEKWRTERTSLSDSLDEELLAQLKRGLSVQESGLYTVVIENSDSDPRPGVRLAFSYASLPVSGPENQLIQYLEWNYF